MRIYTRAYLFISRPSFIGIKVHNFLVLEIMLRNQILVTKKSFHQEFIRSSSMLLFVLKMTAHSNERIGEMIALFKINSRLARITNCLRFHLRPFIQENHFIMNQIHKVQPIFMLQLFLYLSKCLHNIFFVHKSLC